MEIETVFNNWVSNGSEDIEDIPYITKEDAENLKNRGMTSYLQLVGKLFTFCGTQFSSGLIPEEIYKHFRNWLVEIEITNPNEILYVIGRRCNMMFPITHETLVAGSFVKIFEKRR